MDLSNLEKLKVVELRNQLQIRGLDIKGVKAVLIERLRSFLDNGIISNAPIRRSRRTKSTTRSPSPPVRKNTNVAAEVSHLATVTEEKVAETNNETERGDNTNNEDIKLLNISMEYVEQNTHSNMENVGKKEKRTQKKETLSAKSKKRVMKNNSNGKTAIVTQLTIIKPNQVACAATSNQGDREEVDYHNASEFCEEGTTRRANFDVDTDINDEIEKIQSTGEIKCTEIKDENKKGQEGCNGEIYLYNHEADIPIYRENAADDHPIVVNDCSKKACDENRNVDNSSIISVCNSCESENFNCTTKSQSSNEEISFEQIFHDNNKSELVSQLSREVHNDEGNNVEKIQEMPKLRKENRHKEHNNNEVVQKVSMHANDCMPAEFPTNSSTKDLPKPVTPIYEYRSCPEPRHRSLSQSQSRSRSPSINRVTRIDDNLMIKKNDHDTTSFSPEDEPAIEEHQFGLSWCDSDLHLRIDPVTFTSAYPINQDIYALIWSGARSNYGVREGKVCFEVRISDESVLGRSHEFRDEPNVRGFRIGFSVLSTSLLLGEAENSFAYCENGKKATNGKFSAYGLSYGLYDVIGCYLDLDSQPCSIQYTLNGKALGIAFEFENSSLSQLNDAAIFPHILTKGYEYQVNFADNDNLLLNAERKMRKRKKSEKEIRTLENEKDFDSKINKKEKSKSLQMDSDMHEDKYEKEGSKVASKNLISKNNLQGNIPTAIINTVKATIKENSFRTQQKEEQTFIEESNNSKECSEVGNSSNSKIIKTIENGDYGRCANENDKDKNKNAPSSNKLTKLECLVDHTSNTINNDHERHHNYKNDNVLVKDGTKSNEIFKHTFETKSQTKSSLTLLPNYELIALIPEEKYVMGPQRPDNYKDCEVILMIGLPGSGKTTWVQKHIADNIKKRYYVIGADALIDKMTVDGIARKAIHKGCFDRVYELCLYTLPSLESIANKRRRNYILDQTSVYASTQRRKMKGFSNFKRIAVVCLPKDDELKRRLAEKKDKGHQFYTMKKSTLSNTQANFSLPSLEFGWFDDIIYTDLSGEEAKKEVKAINKMGKNFIEQPSTGSIIGSNSSRGADHTSVNKRIRYDNNRRDYTRHPHDDYNRNYNQDNRWSDNRRSGSRNMNINFNYSHYGRSSGGISIHTNGRNRNYNDKFMGEPHNWIQNNKRSYYCDNYRNNRFDAELANCGSGSRNRYGFYDTNWNTRNFHNISDYRNRGNYDRNRNIAHSLGNNGSVNGRNSNGHRPRDRQTDFRVCHRDIGEDNRGGSASISTNTFKRKPFDKRRDFSNGLSSIINSYNNSSHNGGSYGHKEKKEVHAYVHATDSTKWNTYDQQKQQLSQYNSTQEITNWQYCTPQIDGHQQANQQQGFWNYNMGDYTNYGQWHNVNEHHQWITGWQQQQEGQIGEANGVSTNANQHYWSQPLYNTTQQQQDTSAVNSKYASNNSYTNTPTTIVKI